MTMEDLERKFNEAEKKFNEAEKGRRGMERRLDLLVKILGGEDLVDILNDEDSYKVDPEQLREHVLSPDADRNAEVLALQALNTTLDKKLASLQNFSPEGTSIPLSDDTDQRLQDLQDALARPNWENTLGTPNANPGQGGQQAVPQAGQGAPAPKP